MILNVVRKGASSSTRIAFPRWARVVERIKTKISSTESRLIKIGTNTSIKITSTRVTITSTKLIEIELTKASLTRVRTDLNVVE